MIGFGTRGWQAHKILPHRQSMGTHALGISQPSLLTLESLSVPPGYILRW